MYYQYAIKYLDKDGNKLSSGYVESVNEYKPGDIVEDVPGSRMMIDYVIYKGE